MAIQQNLAEDYRLAKRTRETDRLTEHWDQLLEENKLTPRDFSIREMMAAAIDDGSAILEQWQYNPGDRMNLRESGVNMAAFSRINKQLISTEVMQEYQRASFIGDQLVTPTPSPKMFGERVPGAASIGDQAGAVGEGKPYPLVGFNEDFIQVPDKIKRGMICAITKEAILQDQTGLILKRAKEVGYWLGENKESRILNVILGNVSTYNRKNRGVVPNYGDALGAHDWNNLVASNPFVDWTSLDAVRIVMDAITDPNTGTSLAIDGKQILVPSGLAMKVANVINATQIETVDNQAAAGTTRTVSSNPVSGYTALTSPRIAPLQGNQTSWLTGDFKRAFSYLEAWPITTSQAPPNSEEEFQKDIVDRYKVSECGVAIAEDPRYVVKCTG